MNKVCPECGNTHFYRNEVISHKVIVDGNGDTYDVVPDTSSTFIDKDGIITCTDCKQDLTFDELVTEEHFHEVIALEGDEESKREDTKGMLDKFSTEQRHLVWESRFTFVEMSDGLFGCIKSYTRDFGIIDKEKAESIFEEESRVLIVYNDRTHKINWTKGVLS